MSWTSIGAELLREARSQLPDQLQGGFRARARKVLASSHQVVLGEGFQGADVYLIDSGRMQVSLFSHQGRETILREMGPGQIFGELSAIDGQPRSANVTAVEDSVLWHLPGREFVAFLRDTPDAGQWMMSQLSMRVRDLTVRIFELTTMPVNTRLHCLLIRLSRPLEPSGDGAVIDRLPTHNVLAALLGTHRESISRELSQLRKDGVLEKVGRQMHIPSVDRLQKMIIRVVE
jgi:CRP-like cAMP-binding protein